MNESMAKMNAFNDELIKAGVMKDCDGLTLSKEGKRVRFDGDARDVVDGPFQGDLVAGYWIWSYGLLRTPSPGSSAAQTRYLCPQKSRSGRSRAEARW